MKWCCSGEYNRWSKLPPMLSDSRSWTEKVCLSPFETQKKSCRTNKADVTPAWKDLKRFANFFRAIFRCKKFTHNYPTLVYGMVDGHFMKILMIIYCIEVWENSASTQYLLIFSTEVGEGNQGGAGGVWVRQGQERTATHRPQGPLGWRTQ